MLDGPGYPAELASSPKLTQAIVSNHLVCLRGRGLVVATNEGRFVRYDLADSALAHALGELVELVLAANTEAACPPVGGTGGCVQWGQDTVTVLRSVLANPPKSKVV